MTGKQQITTSNQFSKVRLLLADKRDEEYVNELYSIAEVAKEYIEDKSMPFNFPNDNTDFKIIKYYSSCLAIPITDQEITALLSVDPKKEDIEKISNELRILVQQLCPDLVRHLVQVCPFHWGDKYSNFMPLPLMGKRENGVFNYIVGLFNEPHLYEFRIPYKNQLHFISRPEERRYRKDF